MVITTDFSLFKSAIKLNKAIELASQNKFLVIADNNLNAVPQFVFGCRDKNIKPIIAVLKETEYAEYLFIALNDKGYKELLYAETKGYGRNIFKSENIMAILNNVFNKEKVLLPKYAFKRNSTYEFSIEDNYNSFIENSDIQILSPLIINSVNESDHYVVSAMNAVGSKRYMEELSFTTYSNFNYGFNDDVFLSVIDSIEDFVQFGNPMPPEFKFKKEVAVEYGFDPETITDNLLFRHLVMIGLQDRFKGKDIPQNYIDRVNFEMDVIEGMKFPGYFLIVWDFINYARKMGIPVGPGRGSAAGALIAWALKITNIDPMPNGLFFERFLNPDRVSFPDIDIDFCQVRRQEVIDYVIDKYGKDSVAQVITFGTMGAKGAINDSARIQQVPGFISSKISKEIPEEPGISFLKVYESNSDFWDKWRNSDYFISKTWNLALRLEGLNRNHGTHAAAVVISNQPIYEKAPVYEIGGTKDTEGTMAIGFAGKYLEEADLVKYDFLGLKTLTVIELAIKNVFEAYGKKIDLNEIETTDLKVYEYISTGDTRGMFQIESDGMKSLAKRLQPSNFNDITAMLALYRPGPMEAGMLDSFVERKQGREEIDYFFDSMEEVLKPILEPTYGMIVYQEQVMLIVREIAGFTLGGADLVRRAMGKKDEDEMNKLQNEFAKGAVEKGYKEEEAKALFDLIKKFAGYGFNKSHSAAYALITYYTAFLKYYYPAEFMTAIIQLEINSKSKNLDKVAFYIEESKRMGIEVVPPSIETSKIEFSTKNNKIYYGLKGVKSVGTGAIDLSNAFKEHYSNDLLKFFWNLQSDHSASLIKLEKKKATVSKKVQREEISFSKKKISLSKKIKSKKDKLIKINERIEKLKNKYQNMGEFDIETMNERDKNSFEKSQDEITDIENDILELENPEALIKQSTLKIEEAKNEMKVIEEEIIYLNENKIDLPKIKKSDFEGLASVGALNLLGVSRKFLIENLEDLLNPKKVLDIDMSKSKEEYSMVEILPLEMKYLHTTITSPFGETLKDYKLLDLPKGLHIVTILSKVEKKKKDGKTYISAVLKTTNNESYEVGDFQNKLKDKEIGDVFTAMIKINGKYSNLQKIGSVKNIFTQFEMKKKILKLDILEEIPNTLDFDIIEVFDNSVFVMRLFK